MTKLRPRDLENRLLSCLASGDDVLSCERQGISRESFFSTEPIVHADVWDYIVKHVHDTGGRLPTAEDLHALHGFEGSGTGDLQSYVREIRAYELRFKAREVLLRHVDGLSEDADEDPIAVLGRTTSELGELQATGDRRITYYDHDALDRLALFDDARRRAAEKGMIGVPTGLRHWTINNVDYCRARCSSSRRQRA